MRERLDKIYILGTMGSGKTTLSKKLSKIFGINYHSLDDFYWTTKYTRKRNRNVLLKKVRNFANKTRWIVEGVFVSWTEPFAKNADLIIWLDLDYKFLRKHILKRHIKNTIFKKEKERGNFDDILKVIKHTKKYRTGKHKNSYEGHKKLVFKYKSKLIHLQNPKQVKEFLKKLK